MRCACAPRGSREPAMKLTRRNFLAGTAAVAAASTLPSPPQAAPAPAILRVVKRSLEVNGRAASVFGIQQPGGYSGLTTTAAKPFRVRLENQADEETLVHWHGLAPPSMQDGVPGLSQPLIAPGTAYDYDFPLQRAGTFWMHSHQGLQEQGLLAAPLIVLDRDFLSRMEQEVVIMLHDFSFRDPQEIFAGLTGGAVPMDHSMGQGESMPMGEGGMAGMHGGAMTHLNDVEYDAYLANDRTLDDPEIVGVEAGRSIRLRIINGAASTNFWIDFGTLDGALVAVDGSYCRGVDGRMPFRGGLFPLAMSQRVDVVLKIPSPGAYPILARREGDTAQTGIILATPGAAISRVPARGEKAMPALTLDLDRWLTTYEPLAPRPAD